MVECHAAKYCSLHVRETNYAAYHLYKDTLQFNQHGVEEKYYADGENAYDMRKPLTREMFGLPPLPGSEDSKTAEETAPSSGAGLDDKGASGKARKGRKDAAGAPASTPSVTAGASDTAASESKAVDDIIADLEGMDIEPGAKDIQKAHGGGGKKKGGKKK